MSEGTKFKTLYKGDCDALRQKICCGPKSEDFFENYLRDFDRGYYLGENEVNISDVFYTAMLLKLAEKKEELLNSNKDSQPKLNELNEFMEKIDTFKVVIYKSDKINSIFLNNKLEMVNDATNELKKFFDFANSNTFFEEEDAYKNLKNKNDIIYDYSKSAYEEFIKMIEE